MTSPQFPTDSLNIPQAILDHYQTHYNNATYRAFSDALAASLQGGQAHPDHVAVMNLLIDTAFERSGAEVYCGASVQLGVALMTCANPELFALAEQHLLQFNQAADETVLTAGLLHTLDTLRTLAESAGRAASDHHGWQGRVAFWWLNAIAYMAQATCAILNGSHSSYVQEKPTAAGFVIAYPVMNWFTRFPPR